MTKDLKILFTAFNGKENSSKLLLDKISNKNKLYLKNSFINSVKQLESELKKKDYDLIISFGQSFLDKDTIKIETCGKQDKEYRTRFDYKVLKNMLEEKYKVIISSDAGNYLCNNLYYHGLRYISLKSLKTDMIFIHIPKINNISNIEELAAVFDNKNNITL